MKKFLTVIVALMVAMLPVLAFAADKTNTKVTLTASTSEAGFEDLSKLKIEVSLDHGENPAVAFDVLFDGKSVANLRIWPNKDFSTIYAGSNLFGDKVLSVDVADLLSIVAAVLTEIENQLGGIDLAALISEETIVEGIKSLFTDDADDAEIEEVAKEVEEELGKAADALLNKLLGNVDLSKLDFTPVLKNVEAIVAKATVEDAKDVNIDFSTEELGVDPEYKIEIKAPVAKIGKLILEKSDISSFISSIVEVASKVVSIVDAKEVMKIVDDFLDKQVSLKNIELHSFMSDKDELLGAEIQLNAGEDKEGASIDMDLLFSPDEANKLNKFGFAVSVSGIKENHTENSLPLVVVASAVSKDEATPNDGFIVFAFGDEAIGHLLLTAGHKTDAAAKESTTVLGLKLTDADAKQIAAGSLAFSVKGNDSFDIIVNVDGKEFARLNAKVETVDSVPNPDTKDAVAVLKLTDEEKAALEDQIIESATGALFGALTLLAA